ncbi:MAG: hypothetical protein HQ472_04540 [Ignavibacteria bacterium]|nr:hypothetical protein [Ignavibacteria bacterium]
MTDYTEKIHQMLDGELDAIQEPGLFGELSTNGDLRTEFRQQLAIRTAIQNDRMALVPPAALTNSVFSSLGFAAPLAGAVAGAAGGGLLLQWLSRIGIPILSAITAAGITFGVANNADSLSRDINAKNSVAGRNTSTQATTKPLAQNSSTTSSSADPVKIVYRDRFVKVPADADQRVANSNADLKNSNTELRGSIAELRNSIAGLTSENERLSRDNATLQAQNEQMMAELAQLRSNSKSAPIASNADITPITSVRLFNTLEMHNAPAARMLVPTALNAERQFTVYPAYTAQLRGFPLTSTLNTNVAEESAWYYNIGISLLYHTTANHAFGMEFGNENFPMIFDANRDGQIIRYEQSPASAWAGVTYRYTADRIGQTAFAPFVQGLIGGTKFGPLGRVAAGIQYSPVGPLTFILGVEGSAMAYNFQQQWYTSPKYGLTYGMAVKF